MKNLLPLLLFLSSPAEASDQLFRVVAPRGPDEALLTLDKPALEKLLRRAEEGDRVVLPLPGGSAEFRVEYKVLDPALELDCCSVSLVSEQGNALVRLTRSHDVRDFDARVEGHVYRFRATGNGNFRVAGPRLHDGRDLP